MNIEMTSEQKQSELERYRALLLATLDYFLERNGGMIVYDGDDPMTEFYTAQKVRAEKHYQQRRLDRLRESLARQINTLQRRVDLDFEGYIKAKTGYDINIFEDLRKRVDTILANKEVYKQKEHHDINTLIRYYRETSNEKLMALQVEYAKMDTSATPLKKNDGHLHTISKVQKDGVEEVKMMSYTGPKLKHYKEQEELSPDGKRKVAVTQWSAGKHDSTTVSVQFPKANGEIYRVDDICPDIKAFWKDNQTIIIETRKDYTAYPQFNQLRSFDDKITIEYIEINNDEQS